MLPFEYSVFEKETSEEDTKQGSGRCEDTYHMGLASVLQICDPEKIASDLPETAGVLGLAGKDL